jgi:hypothetical protein
MEHVETALAALGLRLIVEVARAAWSKPRRGRTNNWCAETISMTTTHVTIRVRQLPEGVFLATSNDVPGLTVECETRDEIIATAPEIALELFEIEAGRPLKPRPVVTFTFDWSCMASMTYRELRRLLVDHGCRYLRDARGGGHEIWMCPGRKPIGALKTLKGERDSPENLEDAGIKQA